MNTISNMLKYMGLPLSFLVLSTSQAAQISDKERYLLSQANTYDDAKDDEKTDYTIKKSTGLGLLPYNKWPKNRELVYSPSLSKKENNEILINKSKDRRKKINKLPLKLLPNKEPFDIACYIVKVYVHFGSNKDNGEDIEGQGTATIIKIEKGIIYLLTCAHNVIKYEENPYGEDSEYPAKNVSFFYQKKEYLCNDYYVHPKYGIDKGKDIAIITSHRGYGIKFPYVSFPQITSAKKGKYRGYVIGFPGEKEGELYGMSGDLEVKEAFVKYKIDTSSGQSGSAMWSEMDGTYKIIGVHVRSQVDYNCGPLLSNEFTAWGKEYRIQAQKVYNKHMEFFTNPSKMTVILQDPTFDINMTNETGITPFMCAAKEGNLFALKLLKEKGANVNDTDEYGNNALHYAAGFAPDGRGITWLIDSAKLDIESKNKSQKTPFLCAAKKGNLAALKILKEKDANVYAKDEFNCDALHYMVNNDKIKKKIEENQRLTDQLRKKKSNLNSTVKKLEHAEENLEIANHKNKNLINQLKSKSKVLETKKKIIKDKDKVINNTKAKLYEKDIELNEFKNKFNNKNKTLQHAQNKLNEIQLKLYNKENLLNQHKIENEKAQQLIQRLMKQLKDKDNELNRLKTEPKGNNNNINKKYPQHFKYPKNRYKGKALPKNLSNQNLSGYDFTGCAFTYTDLTDTKLENTILINTTCDYQKAFQDNLKKNECYGGKWHQNNLPKDLKSIAEVYPTLKKHADKVKLLHIACGLSRLPFYTGKEFYIKVQYWSCALLQLKNKLGDPYGKQIVCSYAWYLNGNTEYYCWSTDYPQNDDVNLEEKNPHANFGTYLTHFTNGLVKHKCKSKNNWGFNWYKDNIEKNIKGLQKAYPKIESKELQKEACQIGCALSKSYQIRGMLFLFHYLFYQNRLIRLRNSVGVMVKNDIHYNLVQRHALGQSWSHGKK